MKKTVFYPVGDKMAKTIADYALLGDLRCAALVSRDGSIDWFCPGRFDSPACFSSLLGGDEHGFWRIAPRNAGYKVDRRYQEDTLVLETSFSTLSGEVKVIDAMPFGDGCHIIRQVHCVRGEIEMSLKCVPRFHYGRDAGQTGTSDVDDDRFSVIFTYQNTGLQLVADAVPLARDDGEACADFTMKAGDKVSFCLSWAQGSGCATTVPEFDRAIAECAAWWRNWLSRNTYSGPWNDVVKRSLIVLKALTYEPDGGMVAAPTTSLPEIVGGSANWDYRFCWLRDAAFALKVLLNAGYKQEAQAWCHWLVKALGQHDDHFHALYSIDATFTPEEQELNWLPGYLDSRPVRIGNAARDQYQTDVRGELIEILHLARCHGLEPPEELWALQCKILERLNRMWREPDTGIWEFRTICDHLTHSKVLAWVAYDRSIADAERFGLSAPVDEWKKQRDEIRVDVLQNGLDPHGGFFTQRYGAPDVDASLLVIPLVGFLPADDPRMIATVAAIERELCDDGLVRRYRTGDSANEEGVFLTCCFWLADNYWLAGRRTDAESLFARLVNIANDVGLLAEEYDTRHRRLLGNFPQGLSHLALISTARLMATEDFAEVTLE